MSYLVELHLPLESLQHSVIWDCKSHLSFHLLTQLLVRHHLLLKSSPPHRPLLAELATGLPVEGERQRKREEGGGRVSIEKWRNEEECRGREEKVGGGRGVLSPVRRKNSVVRGGA